MQVYRAFSKNVQTNVQTIVVANLILALERCGFIPLSQSYDFALALSAGAFVRLKGLDVSGDEKSLILCR
jgi:hypothetical protein